MQLSIEEVKKLDSNSYQIIDIRSEEEVAHGAIKGALNIQAEEIESDERVPHDKKLVIVCSRGKTSVDVAEYLTEKGFDAASLAHVLYESAKLYNILPSLLCKSIKKPYICRPINRI